MLGTLRVAFSWARDEEPCVYVDRMARPSGSKSTRAEIWGTAGRRESWWRNERVRMSG